MIDLNTIAEASRRIAPYIHVTPILSNKTINSMVGGTILFKCENFQKAGSFKIRGACNAVFSLSELQAKNGVCTHSSGNFGQALALAASYRGIQAHIVMPKTSSCVKVEAVKAYSGNVRFCEPNLMSRESTAREVIDATGAAFIHPYDDYIIMSGQGTAIAEVMRSEQNIDIVMTPVGGGGLISGTAVAAKSLNRKIWVIAAEPIQANDAFRSFYAKKWFPSENPDTIADGLLTSLGERNFALILNFVDDILTCREKSIYEAMRLIWERMKIIIEPSSAVPLACVLENKGIFENKTTCIVLSGGNIDLNRNWFS
ncbi:MAG: pyridoxal-phosphate dependent enzyme [Bacteroidales bacterium]|nr:pyridoxal-phosphate dependent enzyme [Bacteroidales bacterium]HOY38315.1 pyridoxal-phosphate dependent enzyme [Bacteroidales bacterium]HQP04624.1 pyridoxal-phosphate dependent enzyme [Bacteroidales bacterium]